MTIEYILEVLSGSWSILSLCFLIFLVVYLVGQYRDNELTYRDLWGLPLGMVVAIALIVQNTGSFASRVTVWAWRHFHGGSSLTSLNLTAMAISAFVAGVGTLMLIRVFSKPRYGDLPWMLLAAITAVYIVTAVWVR
jgi:hypothetical protein